MESSNNMANNNSNLLSSSYLHSEADTNMMEIEELEHNYDNYNSMDIVQNDIDQVPIFTPLTPMQIQEVGINFRRVNIPPYKINALRNNLKELFEPLTEHLKLQVRYNIKRNAVEMKTSEFTNDLVSLDKACDYIQAFIMGFDLKDSISLLRLDDIYIDSFEITDVKLLHGDHLYRAIGRIAGQGGKTKFAIENATKTRIVLSDKKIHVLGSYQNIALAKDTISRLIMGAPPGKVVNGMRIMANRKSNVF